MATRPGEQQGNSNHAEPPAGAQVLTEERYEVVDVAESVESSDSESRGASEISEHTINDINYRPLLGATFRGDWEFAKAFFERDPASKTAKITSRLDTVLHIAAMSAQDQFLINLVELLSPSELEEVDCGGRTALHNAVLCGRIRMVKALVRRDPQLTQLADNKGRVPLAVSALAASMHKEIAWFLAKKTTDDGPSYPFSSPSAIDFIINLTRAGHHDITLHLVERYPHLLTEKSTRDGETQTILLTLARMPSHFPSGTRLSVLEELIYKCIPVDLSYKPLDKNSEPALKCLTRSPWNAAKTVGMIPFYEVPIIKRMHEVKLRHIAAIKLAKQVCIAVSEMNPTDFTQFFDIKLLFVATIRGINELVKLCIQFFPELFGNSKLNRKLAAAAMVYRRETTLKLFLKESSTKELSLIVAPSMSTSQRMMERAAKHIRSGVVTNVSGAAFQLQRELKWFKAVESWLPPLLRTELHQGKPYWDLFEEEHKILLEKGEKWVRDTANSCMLVSTLIATVLFAASFTMPGGNDNNTGVPVLLGQDSLLVFAISDALGLFSSVMAILLFLAILTSRYELQDFLVSLPRKIIMGLSLLFLSLAFMLVAFAATLRIVLDKRLEWILIPIILLASLPVALFVVLQLPLLYQMVKSTYGRGMFHPDSIWE